MVPTMAVVAEVLAAVLAVVLLVMDNLMDQVVKKDMPQHGIPQRMLMPAMVAMVVHHAFHFRIRDRHFI